VARHRLADVEDRGHVGLHQALEVRRVEILQRRPVLHAGIVDQDVDGPGRRLEIVDGGLHRRMVGGVEGQGMHCRAPGPQALGRLGEAGRVAPVEHDFRARAGKALGQRQADAAARSGDEGAPPRQVKELEAVHGGNPTVG
jgi:hypothetical protein